MQLVINDTGPINYLVLIGHIDIIPALFERVLMPFAVREELSAPKTPSAVRGWLARPPAWLEVRTSPAPSFDDDVLRLLGEGERDAITLAAALHADLLLMDDRDGVKAALRKGLTTTGTIGVLHLAAKQNMIDLADAFARLRRTSFHCPEDLMQTLLAEQKGGGKL